MGVLKGLFLGVYASNGIIRVAFLPLCYLLLSSPFLLVFLRYYGFDSTALALFGQEKSVKEVLLQVFVGVVAFLLPTRVLSTRSWRRSGNDGKRRVQLIPYWIPGMRHWGNVVFGGEGWLVKVRETTFTPITCINLAGAKHNIILSHSLLEQVQKTPTGIDGNDATEWARLRNIFNIPNGSESGYLELQPKFSKAIEDNIFNKQQSEKLVSASIKILTEALPDLVTFNSSIVDQLSWERVANIELTDGTSEAECDLLSLINEFFCGAIITPITGSQFPESYQLLASDLGTVTEYYYALGTGLPRLCPIPGLPGAMLAKKRLFQNFERLFYELENPKKRVPDDDESMSGEETDADTPTPLTAMNDFFSQNEVPIAARAAITLHLLHNLFSEIIPLAFWTLLQLHTSVATQTKTQPKGADTFIDNIRKETQIWVQATQPPSIHPSFPAPPEISFSSLPRLVSQTSFPLLRSAITEARRLYAAPITTFRVTAPTTLTETETLRPGAKEEWQLDTGSNIATGLSQHLINTSPAHFTAPTEFKPDRFKHNTTFPSSPFPQQESLATPLLIAFVAGVLQLWEFAPAPKKSFFDHMQEAQAAAMGPVDGKAVPSGERKVGEWVLPKAGDGAGVRVPRGDVRVRVRRREGLPERRSLRKGR